MKPDKIKVALVDDHTLLRDALASMLQQVDDIQIIGSVSSGEEIINKVQSINPHVILMDIMMKGMTGIEATRWIKEQNPKIKIILISSEVNKDYITAGIKSGIDGYLPKDTNKETLLNAIHTAMKGERYFSPDVTALIFQDFYLKEKDGKGLPSRKTNELTKREEEVLVLIAYGKSLKDIAEELTVAMLFRCLIVI